MRWWSLTRVRAGLPGLAVAALLAATAGVAGLATPELGMSELSGPLAEPPPPPARPPGAPPGAPDRTGTGATPEGWPLAGLAGGTLLVAGLVAAGWAVWLRLRRRRPGSPQWFRLRPLRPASPGRPEDRPAGAELLAAVDAAVACSGDDPDPRRAVIGCWLRLEAAAAAAGTPRLAPETATDLVLRLLRGHRVSEPVLAGFATAYRRARYAAHPVDEPARVAARAALRQLQAELPAQLAPGQGVR